MKARILVVDDEDAIRTSLTKFLRDRKGHQVDAAADGNEAWGRLAAAEYDLVLTDLVMPGINGLELIGRARAERPDVPIVVLSGRAIFRDVVDAMRAGAYDFIAKPVEDLEELATVVERALERRRLVAENETLRDTNRALQEALGAAPPADDIVGESPALRAALKDAEVVAPTDSTVLLRGETGTGKELVARALHAIGPRSDRPFTLINCAAVHESAFEAELFGMASGVFPACPEGRPGLLEQADGGMVFLDEVSNLPLAAQARLLRVLECGELHRVGSLEARRLDVAVVAATNRNLRAEAAAGRFRSDLLYRLNAVEIALPPLRERREDIPYLTAAFVRACGSRLGKAIRGLTTAAEALLVAAPWEGNVRELQNVLERACLLAEGELLTEREVAAAMPASSLRGLASRPGANVSDVGNGDRDLLSTVEREHILKALQRTGGNKKAAARMLGVSRRALYRRLERLDLGATIQRRRHEGGAGPATGTHG